MNKLLESSKNYRITTGSLWNYYRDEQTNHLSSNFESFKHKASITDTKIRLVLLKKGWTQIKLVKVKLELLFH